MFCAARWLLRLPQRLVVAAERRAAVAADEAGGVQAEHRVALLLQHRQAHQRLHAAHEGAAVLEAVLVVERDALERLADRVGKRCIHRGFRLRGEARRRSVPARLVTGCTPESVGIRHGRRARGAGHATVTAAVDGRDRRLRSRQGGGAQGRRLKEAIPSPAVAARHVCARCNETERIPGICRIPTSLQERPFDESPCSRHAGRGSRCLRSARSRR